MAELSAVQGTVRTTKVQASTVVRTDRPPISTVDFAVKRTAHGSSAWVVPQHLKSRWQPQDGAATAQAAFDSEPVVAPAADSSRSLTRRLMGLNIAVATEVVEPARKPANRSLHLVGQQVA